MRLQRSRRAISAVRRAREIAEMYNPSTPERSSASLPGVELQRPILDRAEEETPAGAVAAPVGPVRSPGWASVAVYATVKCLLTVLAIGAFTASDVVVGFGLSCDGLLF